MKKLALLFFLCVGSAAAQDSPFPFQSVFSGSGRPLPGAIISICVHPAVGSPCSNFATVYSDQARTQQINQLTSPVKTDSFGNVPATYAAPGLYDYTISGAGISTQGPYSITISCTPGISCVSNPTTGAIVINSPGSLTVNGTGTFTGRVIDAGHVVMNPTASDWCAELTAGVALLPSTGGKVESTAQGTQTCAAGVSVSTKGVQITITPGITIPLGANQFAVSSGAQNFSMSCGGVSALNGAGGGVAPCLFTYTGTGDAIKLGDTSARTYGLNVEGIGVSLASAGSAAIGIHTYQAFNGKLHLDQVLCSGSASTQQGITIDGTTGTPGFSDLLTVDSNRVTGCGGIQLHVNGGTLGVNGVVITGGASEYNCANVAGSVGIKLDQPSGNGGTTQAWWPDVESCPLGLEVNGNYNRGLFLRMENNTTTVQFDSGASYNSVYTSNITNTATDNSGNLTNCMNSLCAIQLSGNGSNTAFPANYKAGFNGSVGSVRMSAAATNGGIFGAIGAARTEAEAATSFSSGVYGGYDFSTTDKGAGGIFESTGATAAVFGLLGSQPGGSPRFRVNTNGSTDWINSAPFSTGLAGSARCGSDATGNLTCSYNNGTLGQVTLNNATQALTNKTLNVPLTSGTGLQIFNTTTTCTTAASVGATCTTAAISLPVAEADTSYRVVATCKGPTAVPVVSSTANSSATQFTITIAALTAVAASCSSFDVIAGHN